MQIRLRFLILLLLAAASSAAAQSSPPDSLDADDMSGDSGWFPPRLATTGGLVFLPKLYYSSDNKLGAGLQVLRPFRFPGCPDEAPNSDVAAKLRVTVQGYTRSEFTSTLFPSNPDWMFRAKLSYDNLNRRFWGIGKNTPSEAEELYRPKNMRAYVELLHSLFFDLRVGVRAEYQRYSYDEVDEGGILAQGDFPGAEASGLAGVGVLAEWDTRDDRRDPHRGHYFQAFALSFGEETGSDHSFNNYNVDLRGYLPLARDHVLALQGFLYSALGGAPIWRYAELGGRPHSRGYRRGRYVDRVLVAFQGEYRWHAFWRLGLNAFGGLSNVTDEFHHLEFEHMRPTVGSGILFWPSKSSNVVIRSELAVGEDSFRAYLSIGEAF